MGLFNNMALLYVCVLISCMFYNPALVVGDSPTAQSVLGFFNIQVDSNNSAHISSGTFSNSTSEATDRMLSEGRSVDKDNNPLQSFLMLIDTTWNTIMFITLFFRFLFAPIIILNALLVPSFIVFTFGVPFVFMGLVSIIMIIRGYS